MLAGLCLAALTACNPVTAEEPKGEPALKDPQTGALYCEICPIAPGQPQTLARTPITDEVTGQAYCNPCYGYCGDGWCEWPEDSNNCPWDCGSPPYCGDGVCNGGETCSSCSADCGSCGPYCGDGVCNGSETCASCSGDCGSCPGPLCGDGVCEYPETRYSCPEDCWWDPCAQGEACR